MDFLTPFSTCDYPWEHSRIWTLDRQRAIKREELLQTIRTQISPLSMQAQRDVMLSVRLLMWENSWNS